MVVVQHRERVIHVLRLLRIAIVTHVRVDQYHQVHLVVMEHPVRYLRYAVVVRLRERVIHVLRLLRIAIVTRVRVVRFLQAHLVVTEHPVRYLRYAVVVRLRVHVMFVNLLLRAPHYLMKPAVHMEQKAVQMVVVVLGCVVSHVRH